MSNTDLVARNEDFTKIIEILTAQQGRKLDVITPATKMRLTDDGKLVVEGMEMAMDEDGVTPVDGIYQPGDAFFDGVSDKLSIPRQFLRRLVSERPDILAGVVNGFLHGSADPLFADSDVVIPDQPSYPSDSRRFLLRLFRGDDGGEGVARAMLGDRYSLNMDNLDTLTAVLGGVQLAGHPVNISSCDLSEKYLHVRLEAPEVRMLAPILLAGYRNPFADPSVKRAGGWSVDRARAAAQREGKAYEPGSEPVVWAGFDVRTSELGYGAVNLTPVLTVEICGNALRLDVDSFRKIHLGKRQEEGIFQPSSATQRASLELIKNEAADAVRGWLDIDFIRRTIERLEEEAGVPVNNAIETIETVTRGLQFSNAERESVLQCFVLGGQMNAGGIMQAVSAAAQTIEDADRAFEMEGKAIPAMAAAAKLAN